MNELQPEVVQKTTSTNMMETMYSERDYEKLKDKLYIAEKEINYYRSMSFFWRLMFIFKIVKVENEEG